LGSSSNPLATFITLLLLFPTAPLVLLIACKGGLARSA
jgi:hypothetical protein